MVELEPTRSPIQEVLLATVSERKRLANERNIDEFARQAETTVPVDTVNPEIFQPEADHTRVDEVAWEKTETLRQNLDFDPEKRTLIVAFDVATFIADSEEQMGTEEAVDLKRLLRDIKVSPDEDAQEQWDHIIEVMRAEKIRMLERCCNNGTFCIEWHVGFAINSNDGVVSNRGALVLRATFNAFDPEVVMSAFTLSDELEAMKINGQVPTHEQLAEGVQALAIGPRLPFAELLEKYGEVDNLVAFNRDYPEERAQMNPEQFLNIVRDCALPINIGLQMLAGSIDPDQPQKSPEQHLQKPTVRLSLAA